MSIDYIKKSLETMLYFKNASILETFTSDEDHSFIVQYLSDTQQFKVKSSISPDIKLFDSVDEASYWIAQNFSLPSTQI